jgi:hypothetical protein
LNQYFSDQKAPLMVADSVALLLDYSPDFVAAQIQAWVASQALTAPIGDYLFHAAKKISMMGEFELVPKDALSVHLEKLSDALLQYCPDAERDVLKQNLGRLGAATKVTAANQAAVLHRPSGIQTAQTPQAPPAQQAPAAQSMAADPELARSLRRLSLLLENLRPLAAAPVEQRSEMASQFLSAAAVQSKNAQELEAHLAPLRQLGVDVETGEVFRTLAASLAGWALPQLKGQKAPAVSRDQLQAMRQIVSLADQPAEVAKRFRQMVHAAVEQFNAGHLGRAATMFELAERLSEEQKVQKPFVDALRNQGHEYLEPERLKKTARREELRGQLRPILSFFSSLRPEGLLKSLDGEPNRERRHELLELLEVHGSASRSAAWELLKASVEPGANVDPYFQMNLVYLLRILPRPEDVPVEAEVNVVMQVSGRTSPPPLVKQVIQYLGHTRHDKAERALITYLKVFENMQLQPDTASYTPDEVEKLLDRTCAALARYGTPRAWLLLIDHGLKSEARLGSPFLRLVEAGRLDFSKSPDLVKRILASLNAELPRGGVFGFAAKKNEEKAISLIQSLAGTPLPEVKEALEQIAENFGERKLGETATKALNSIASVGKPPPPPAGLSGDLELFGLPNLLQTVSQSNLSGVLSLLTTQGETKATLLFERGHFRGGQFGPVPGEAALYQLLERPFPGTFALVSRSDLSAQPGAAPAQELLPLLMEGVRRHDEFKHAAATAPDDTPWKPSGKPRPTPLQDEAADFTAQVWQHVAAGKTPQQCESVIPADSYRVRRLVAHWVEEGALQKA